MRPAGSTSGSVTRNHVAAFSQATGQLLSWDPNANGTVQALAASGGRVYLGGSFSNVGGTARTRLAAVDATTGAVVSGFNPRPDAAVASLAGLGLDAVRGRVVPERQRHAAGEPGGVRRDHRRAQHDVGSRPPTTS